MNKGEGQNEDCTGREIGRYRLVEKLGEGFGGVVYAALDRTTGETVALKQLSRWSDVRDASREFAILSRLQHPCLVRVLDFQYDDTGRPFYTMELLPGAGERRAGPLPEVDAFLRIARDLLAGLSYLHAQGVVHADLKPTNIYFPDDPRTPLRLLDFGLALQAGETEGTPRGTLVYLAPEVLRGNVPDEASDLYSLGVVLHELLTGSPVFAGSTEDILRAKLNCAPTSVRAERPDVPKEIAEVVQRLLAQAPSARYRSASEVIAALAEATGDAHLTDEVRGRGHRGRARLVGRESLLHLVEGALGWSPQAAPDRGTLVCICGKSGVGKSRIVDEVAVRARLREFEVIELGSMDAARQRLGLATLLGVSRPPNASRGGVQGFDALLGDALVERSQHRPIAITMDASAHNADSMQNWLRILGRVSSVAPLWVIAEFAAGTPPGEGLSIEIPPLSAGKVEPFVEASLGPVEELSALSQVLHARSAGVPATLERDLRSLVRGGQIRYRSGRWFADLEAVHETAIPLVDQAAARAFVAGLCPDGLRAISAVAVLGDYATDTTLHRVVELDLGDAVEALVADGVLRRNGAHLRAATPALAEAAVRATTGASIARLHESILDLDIATDPYLAQGHAVAAGRVAQAVCLGVQAASRAADAFDFPRAISALKRSVDARLLVDDPTVTSRIELLQQLGDVQMRAGDFTGAAESFSAAIDAAAKAPPRLHLALGRALAEGGKHDDALQAFAHGRCCRKCSHCLELAFAHGWSLTMLGRYDEAREVGHEGLRSPIAQEDYAGAAQLRYLLGTVAWHAGDHQEAVDILTDTVADAEDRDDDLLLADALKGLGTALRYQGKLEDAAAAYRRASSEFQRLGLLPEVAKALNNEGVTAYMRGRWGEAQTKWEQFSDVVDRLGHSNERVHALNNLGVLYKDRGELEKAVRTFETGRALASQLGYTRFEAMLHGNLADAQIRRGQFQEAAEALDTCERLAREVGAQGELVEASRRRAELKLAEGAPRQALALARAALGPAGGAVGTTEEALLHRVCGLAFLGLGQTADATRAIHEAKGQFEEQGARYELAQTYISEAQLQRLKRDPRGAVKLLDQAIQILEPLGARLDLEEARTELTAARQDIQNAGGAAAKLRMVLQCAREIARIRQLEPLLHALVDAALDVTNHERGFVVLYDEGGRRSVEVGHNFDRQEFTSSGSAPSHSIADLVRTTAEPLGSMDLSHDERFASQRSIVLGGIRSARCVPINGSAGVIGVLYTDSPFVGTSTDSIQDDLEVLGALADHAGVAIENVRLLQERTDRYTLVARTAHEINRPLTPLLYYAHDLLARSGHLPSQDREALGIIASQAERLHRFTRQVLELGRMNEPNLELHLAAVHPDDVIVPALRVLRPLFQAGALDLQFTPTREDVAIVADEDKLTQVISNLVSNAVKFTPRGGTVRVRVRTEEPDEDQTPRWLRRMDGDDGRHPSRLVRIEIEDSGVGIPTAQQDNVFDTFVQVHPDAQKRAEGSGLGLTICREIVEAHRGRIWVETAPGGGARFTVELAAALKTVPRRHRAGPVRNRTTNASAPLARAGRAPSEV